MKLKMLIAAAFVAASSLALSNENLPVRIATTTQGDSFFSHPESWRFDGNTWFEQKITQATPAENRVIVYYHRISAADCVRGHGTAYIRINHPAAPWNPVHQFNVSGDRVTDRLAAMLCIIGKKSVEEFRQQQSVPPQ